MEKYRADFHIHIGERSEENIVSEARQNQVSVLVALDRNIVRTKRLSSLINEAYQYDITVLPGIEILTEVNYQGHEENLELVGIDFNLCDELIYKTFDPEGNTQKDKHQDKIKHQKGFLESEGFKIEIDGNVELWRDIEEGRTAETALALCTLIASNPENQPLIKSFADEIEQHLQKRPQDIVLPIPKFLYWKYFAVDKPGYKKWQLEFETIVNTIHQAGGVVVLAHPEFQHSNPTSSIPEMVDWLFDKGVDGLEGWDAGLLNKRLAQMALRRDKLVLGGSGQDLTRYFNRIMGFGDVSNPTMYISPSKLESIRKYRI